ncbi:MAG TPA: VIT1/CCC1 transporter family protein [Candidatus Limnocylindrales bacterium]|nr:VIT1/CCC1 transporter family protein [Candidatus Limnocylindrales bacterium]
MTALPTVRPAIAVIESTAPATDEELPRGSWGAALIRDIILGGQDGLVNVLGLVLGMAVATGSARVVITAGLAAMLAESIAMAGVAFTSTGAERQAGSMLRAALAGRRDQNLAARTAARAERLASAGLPPELIATIDGEVSAEAAAWQAQLDASRAALAPIRETRPLRAAAVVGLSTACGSSVPLLPFIFLPIAVAPPVALAVATVVLATAGLQRARLAGGSMIRSALEMVLIGVVSAIAGALIGHLIGGPVG